MWVLPRPWYPRDCRDEFPQMAAGALLCMVEGYDRKLQWMTADEITSSWTPHHFRTDPTPRPRWIHQGAQVRWIVNEARDIPGEVVVLNERVGWGIVVCMTNLKDYSEQEYRASVGARRGRFFWCEQRFTCWFCRSKDLVEGLRPLIPPRQTVWDRIRDRTHWVEPTDARP